MGLRGRLFLLGKIGKKMRQFGFWIPLSKSGEDYRIAGIVSTDAVDLEGERVLQEGLDWDYFLQHGWFNLNHRNDPDAVVGYPDKVERVELEGGRVGTRVEGYLIKGYEPAERVWQLLKALEGTDRSLGFSIEGDVLEREGAEGKVIKRALVRNVAITPNPVNPDARIEVAAKALVKALTAGHSTPEYEGGGSGAALMHQDLDRNVVSVGIDEDEAVLMVLKKRPDWSYEKALAVARKILARIGGGNG